MGGTLYLPVRKDKFGKLQAFVVTTFPENYLEVEYGSLILSLGAFKAKFINPNVSEEEIVGTLDELVGKKVELHLKFKMLKISQGIKEIDLTYLAPEGVDKKESDSSIVLPISPSGFGDVAGEARVVDGKTVIELADGEIMIDFPVKLEGKVTLSYGLSKLAVSESENRNVSYNLLKLF